MAHDREVAGIRCSEVLGVLEEYVDGDLSPEVRQRVELHLAGCDWCERFGGQYVGTIKALRLQLRDEVAEVPDALEVLEKIKET